MSTPPLPPRPPVFDHAPRQPSLPPPLPPLPADFHPDGLQPHLAEPLVAPRPQKLMRDVPADMARRLDDQVAAHSGAPGGFRQPMPNYRGPSPYLPQPAFAPPRMGPSPQPGFAPPRMGPSPQPGYNPPRMGPSPQPGYVPPQPAWTSGGPPQPHRASTAGIAQSLANVSLNPPAEPLANPYDARPPPHRSTLPPNGSYDRRLSTSHSPPRKNSTGVPVLTATFPTVQSLSQSRNVSDPQSQVAWSRDVFWLVDRSQQTTGSSPAPGPAKISDPQLQSVAEQAVNIILRITPQLPLQNPPLYIAESVYLRGKLVNTGAFPELVAPSPREAFRLFEASARAGYAPAWFQLGRDYENVNDATRARDCFERGVRAGVEACYYRMGMAYLLGQLDVPSDIPKALPLLQNGATHASLEVPQPAYVYGLLLLGEFPAITVPAHLFNPHIPPGASIQSEARKHIERAAYLGFSPAQYKMGHAYEYAISPFPFDPLLSVQYYSLASQQGEDEADMALSKWFLCGAEGAFDKDENLAQVFAEKAARKGLATAQFALGYYAEVGVGRPKDMEAATKWYAKAAAQGNQDAKDRLAALSQPTPQVLSRQEHENITDVKLVRKRTQAKNNAMASGRTTGRTTGQTEANQVVGMIRHQSKSRTHERPPAGHRDSSFSIQQLPPPGAGASRINALPGGTLPSQPGPPRKSSRIVPGAQPPQPRPDSFGAGAGALPAAPNEEDVQRNSVASPPAPQDNPVPGPGSPRPSKAGFNTFQEMGFNSTKLEDKDCVIM